VSFVAGKARHIWECLVVSHAEDHYKLNASPQHKSDRLARQVARIEKKVEKRRGGGLFWRYLCVDCSVVDSDSAALGSVVVVDDEAHH
jgi:hypothetical protein